MNSEAIGYYPEPV